ncbi:hypothetical protein HCH_00845 [Hahella chejuensis KCTC 2396]|uniref:Uncharacterized protein n=1 Tax=Hahella chejuensis (strain KCTC 2396) TaxID=349521 RepID=Q2SNN7_HAHCH|nr:hypothetical protein [Hahella chejuensis]ABC27737.1 hypothetical protein HCH_00845 [Hahella chejuensis KCTC 2396]
MKRLVLVILLIMVNSAGLARGNIIQGNGLGLDDAPGTIETIDAAEKEEIKTNLSENKELPVYSNAKENNSSGNVEGDEDEFSFGLKDFVYVCGVILGVINIFLIFWFRWSDKSRSIYDDFWLRKVIIPSVIDPFKKFIFECCKNYNGYVMKEGEYEDFEKNVEDIREYFDLVSIFSPDLTVKVEAYLDELLKYVSSRSFPGDVYDDSDTVGIAECNPFLRCFNQVVKAFVEAHIKVKTFKS